MLLGTRNITSGDIRRCEIDYTDFLTAAGATGHLVSPSVVIAPSTPSATSTIQSFLMNAQENRLFFYVKGGIVGESFMVNVQIMDSQGETVNDTVQFLVVSP